MANGKIEHATLSNGLTLIGEPNKLNSSAAIGFFVRTGSRDETEKEAGVSHFLEHMMFKGTPKRSALEITYELGNLGAQANAFTSEENTVYYSAIIPEKFSAMQELLSDMLRPALDPEEFSTEKKVILEEIALYQDRPHFYFFEHAQKDYFAQHPAGNSVLGSTASITALAQPEMSTYFKRRYAPNNIVLVAAGNFSWDDFVRDAERHCGGWVPADTGRKLEEYAGSQITKTYYKKNLTQAHVLFMGPGSSAQADERYPLSLLASMIGDSSGSRLYWELIDSGLAESAGCDHDEKDGVGSMMTFASTVPERIDEVAKIVQKILSTPLEFSEQDLTRARNKLVAKIVLNGELPLGRLMALGLEWNYRKQSTKLSEVIRKVQAIDRPQIEAAVKKYPLGRYAEFRLLPASAEVS